MENLLKTQRFWLRGQSREIVHSWFRDGFALLKLSRELSQTAWSQWGSCIQDKTRCPWLVARRSSRCGAVRILDLDRLLKVSAGQACRGIHCQIRNALLLGRFQHVESVVNSRAPALIWLHTTLNFVSGQLCSTFRHRAPAAVCFTVPACVSLSPSRALATAFWTSWDALGSLRVLLEWFLGI